MYENHNFLRETVVEINAAVVGISQHRWIGIGENATESEAKELMQTHNFDILPINSESGVRNYFHTIERNNYDKIKKSEINHKDTIPLQTHIRDVLKNFFIEDRSFFFLLDETSISGLISESNLNSRQVKIWLFSLLSELEIRLGSLAMKFFKDEEKLKEAVFAINDRNSNNSKNRFQKDLEKGTDLKFVEYLYLSTLIRLIKDEKLFSSLGYKNKETFEREYKKY